MKGGTQMLKIDCLDRVEITLEDVSVIHGETTTYVHFDINPDDTYYINEDGVITSDVEEFNYLKQLDSNGLDDGLCDVEDLETVELSGAVITSEMLELEEAYPDDSDEDLLQRVFNRHWNN